MTSAIRFLVFIVLALVGTTSAFGSQRAALVIGNGAYRSVTPLVNPANDASDMAASLGRIGYDVTLVKDGDLQAMNDGLRAFLRNADHADSVVVFYSGHGVQVKGRNYLIPVSAKITDELDLDTQTLSLDKLLDLVDGASPKVKIVILDSCRDNPLTHALVRGGGTRGLARIDLDAAEAKGTLIAFSTAPGSVAQDGSGRNSPFTAALLAHIETPDVDIRQMFGQVRADVDQATQGSQTPWVNEAIIGTFDMAGGNGLASPTRRIQVEAADPQPQPAQTAVLSEPVQPAVEAQPAEKAVPLVPAATIHPSFPCNGMLNATEAAICQDDNLAALDQGMSAAYAAGSNALPAGARQQMAASQTAWRGQRDRCGNDIGCVSASYQQRLAFLGPLSQGANHRIEPSFPCGGRLNPTERSICQTAELARLDQALNAAYKNHLAAMPLYARADFQANEGAWRLQQRDRCGSATSCIEAAYWQRLTVFQAGQ